MSRGARCEQVEEKETYHLLVLQEHEVPTHKQPRGTPIPPHGARLASDPGSATGCVASSKSLNLSKPWFPLQGNEEYKTASLDSITVTVPVIPFEIKLWNLLLFTIALLTKEEGWGAHPLPPQRPTVAVGAPSTCSSLITGSPSPISASPGCRLHLLTSLGLIPPPEST